jgi:hypothetical protein
MMIRPPIPALIRRVQAVFDQVGRQRLQMVLRRSLRFSSGTSKRPKDSALRRSHFPVIRIKEFAETLLFTRLPVN